jgi:hypothetical protein
LSFLRTGRYYRPLFDPQNTDSSALNLLLLLLPFAVIAAPPAGPDTLVVCPNEFRPALVQWEKFRRDQGHVVAVVGVPTSAEQLKTTIRRMNQNGALKYVVLIGDEPNAQDSRVRAMQVTVPTNYVPGEVNIRWGPEKEIASDTPYGDADGDGAPDIAVGRIPARSATELAAVVRKVIRYEQLTDHGPWEKSLNIVSGTGGFGAVTDAMVEAASPNPDERDKIDFVSCARRELNSGGLAWIYVGHGLPTELVYAASATGIHSMLSMRDVPQLHCGPHNPLAVLLACYTGAMDAPHGCLGEELLLAEEGPVAVIAATRVTMPYGNTVMGCELLRACFQDRPVAVGDVLRLAQQRVIAPTDMEQSSKDQLRAALDGLAQLLSPPPVDLRAERREHVLMYQLIGDPLLRLHRPDTEVARVQASAAKAR